MPCPPDKVDIAMVAVDSIVRILVQPHPPAGTDFAHIYRAAMGVIWDARALAVGVAGALGS